MRILIVSEVFWPEDFIVNDLALVWRKLGHDIEVVTPYPSYPQGFPFYGYTNKGYRDETWEGITIHRFSFVEGYKTNKIKKVLNYFDFVIKGRARAKGLNSNYDCIFVSQTGPLTVAIPAFVLKRKYKIPVYIWTCDIWPDAVYSYGIPENKITSFILNQLIRYIYNRCDKIFVSSQKFTETIEQYTSTRIVYVPNWLRPCKEEKTDILFDPSKIHFTFTGNISLYQNLANVVEGFVKANISSSIFNIIGDGSNFERVKEVVSSLHAENVILHGRKPYGQMNDIMNHSDVLVLPLISNKGIEKTEPFKLQSYLFSGKTILGILNGSGREIIEQNEVGICVDPDSVESIADGFRKALIYSKNYSDLVKDNALKLLNGRFNKQNILNILNKEMSLS